MTIKYDGSERCILKLIAQLPGSSKAIRRVEKNIVIPTKTGAKQVYIGDTVDIDGENVTVIAK